ncbi:MAG: glycosyltransferase family 4 protein [Planctomycetota bacterium]
MTPPLPVSASAANEPTARATGPASPKPGPTPRIAESAPDHTPTGPRLRVLVEAFATSPYRGSESGGGWNVVRRLAEHHDVTVLCFPGYGRDAVEALDRHVAEHGPVSGLTVHWVEQPPLSRLFQREGAWQRAFYYHGYRAWEKRALRVARRLHAERPFDLVHRLNMTGFREPGFLHEMGLPYAWGPIAGAVMMPKPFFRLLSPRDRAFYRVRNVLNARQMRTKRRCRTAAAAADRLWAVDELNRAMVREHFGAQAEIMLDSACEPNAEGFVRSYTGQTPLRVLWSGVHEGRKCLPILLHALAVLRDEGRAIALTVLSEGRETASWKRLASSLNLDDMIEWTGILPHGRAVARMRDSDVFVLTSLQEAATHVVMESLASGLPVVCHDACGMGIAVDETCGLKIPLVDPETSITGFADALRELLDRPERIDELSAGALARSRELSWAGKAARIAAAYREMVGVAPKPG